MTYSRARTERRLAARQHHSQAVLRLTPAKYLAMPRNERKQLVRRARRAARTCAVCGQGSVDMAECNRCAIDEDVRIERSLDV